MKHRITGVILAGGASKRMGRNKAQLPLGERRMIEWVAGALDCLFDEVLIVTHHPQSFPMLDNVRIVQDLISVESRSSLVGLYTGLYHARNDLIFAVPCDMPLLNRAVIEHMITLLDGEDVRVPLIGSHFQPLHAFYQKGCLPHMRRHIDRKNFKVIRFYEDVLVRTVDEKVLRQFDPELDCFINVNGNQEYEMVQVIWKERAQQWCHEWMKQPPVRRRELTYDNRRSIGDSQRTR